MRQANSHRMFRKDLIDLLHDNPMSVTQIARLVKQSPDDVADDLEHLFLSLKHTEYSGVITPARCRKCGFEFAGDKLGKPSKCPAFNDTAPTEPRVSIERKT